SVMRSPRTRMRRPAKRATKDRAWAADGSGKGALAGGGWRAQGSTRAGRRKAWRGWGCGGRPPAKYKGRGARGRADCRCTEGVMSTPLSRRDRVMATVAGDDVDRPPMSFWGHFYDREESARDLAEATLEFRARYDWDFVKLNPRASYHGEGWGLSYSW